MHGRALFFLSMALFSCDGGPQAPDAPVAGATTYLTPTEQLVRASMVLRGTRPSLAELDAVQADPSALEAKVEEYVESPEFLETIKDLHAERLQLRTDTQFQLPVEGILADKGYTQEDIYHATTESPLEFVKNVVQNDLPYTSIVTADWTVTNDVLADMYGLPYDPKDAGNHDAWQVSHWTDGRPEAGLLSDSEMWRRHVSNGYNFHRGRANFVADAFLCEDFASRNVLVTGGTPLNDPQATANRLNSDQACIGCHGALDPLAAFFWGYKEQIMRNAVTSAYGSNCTYPWQNGIDPYRGSYRPEQFCYPLEFYEAAQQDGWDTYGLPAPAYYGVPGSDVTDLGRYIAEDPRFSMCTVRNFYSYFAEVDRMDIPVQLATDLRDDFVAHNFSAKRLASQIMLSDAFRIAKLGSPTSTDFAPGAIAIRPEQYDRTVADLTGFTWSTDVDDLAKGCAAGTNTCWGTTDLMTTDRYGYRAMFGGTDGLQVLNPIYGATPTKMMVMDAFGTAAAAFVVDHDFALDRSARTLLDQIDEGVTDEAAVRGQLAALHLRILGQFVLGDSPEVDRSYQLFTDALALDGTPDAAWKLVISALLQDPQMLFY
jgi:hypothetical protein